MSNRSLDGTPVDPTLVGFTPANLFTARQAFAGAWAAAPVRVNCVGDSLTSGGGLTTGSAPAAAWATQLANLLAIDGPPVTSTGLVLLGTNSNSSLLSAPGVDSRVTLVTGTWTYAQPGIGGATCLFGQQTNADQMTFRDPNQQVDTFILYMLSGSGAASFTVVVDSGSPITINPNASGNPTINGVTWSSISAGSAGIHTLTINSPTTAGKNVYVAGVEGLVGTTGLRVSRIGVGGQTSSGWVTHVSEVTSFVPAALTILMIGTNDFLTQVNPTSVYLANLNTLIADFKANGSVILMVPPTPSDVLTIPWTTYVQQMYAAAAANNVPIIDLGQRWVNYALANAAGLFADARHPNNKGNRDMATAVRGALRQACLV